MTSECRPLAGEGIQRESALSRSTWTPPPVFLDFFWCHASSLSVLDLGQRQWRGIALDMGQQTRGDSAESMGGKHHKKAVALAGRSRRHGPDQPPERRLWYHGISTRHGRPYKCLVLKPDTRCGGKGAFSAVRGSDPAPRGRQTGHFVPSPRRSPSSVRNPRTQDPLTYRRQVRILPYYLGCS